MATALAEKAKEAFVDDDFELAVDLYAQAISLHPQNADFFADRAQANIKLKNFDEAVADANKAIELDSSSVKAYLRKGTACIKLGEYQTAKAALVAGDALVQNDSRFTKLIKECDDHIPESANSNGISKPDPSHNGVPASNGSKASNISTENQPNGDSNQKNEMELVQPKYRHAFYQKPEELVVTIFAKGVPAESIVIEFGEQILSVTIDIPGERPYHFQPRLFGKIVPDKCRYEVLSTKVEIRLAKAEAINWASLEFNQEIAVKQTYSSSVVTTVGSGRPAYPSSKRRVVDWDKLEAQVKKEEKKEQLNGDAGANKLFGEIYKNADEDMRRAMTKSFYESNGTVLSTDWKDVGSKKIEVSSPDGMELKKW